MAASGYLNTDVRYDSYFWFQWSQKGVQDIANNQTTISWSCGVYCGHNFYNNAIKMSAISINGTQVYSGGTYSNFKTGNHTIASGTLTITHNSDGTKKFTVSAFTGWLYSNYNYSSSADEFELDPIPRASVPTLSATAVDFGGSITIYTNRASTSFKHTLFYKLGSNGNWVDLGTAKSIDNSYVWSEIPKNLMNSIPNAESETIYIWCETWNGSNYLGSNTVSFTARVPTGTAYSPSIGGIAWTKTSGEPSSWPMTQHVSQGILSMTGVSGAYGSTISSYSMTFAGHSSARSSLNVVQLASEGTFKAVAKVTDSRGRSAVKEVEFTVAAYSQPTLNVTAFRCDNTGAEDTSGDFFYIKATAEATAVGNNSIQLVMLHYKRKSDVAYQQLELESGEETILIASSDSTWEWEVVASDWVSSVSVGGSIPTADVVLDILANGKGIKFGGVAEKEGFDSAWPFSQDGIPQVDYVVERGNYGIWTYEKWASGKAECWGLYTIQDVMIESAWGALYESNSGYSVNFPPELFEIPPCLNLSVQTATSYSVASIEMYGSTTKEKTATFYFLRPTVGYVGELVVGIRAVGYWKDGYMIA